jgi:hypothetical protein
LTAPAAVLQASAVATPSQGESPDLITAAARQADSVRLAATERSKPPHRITTVRPAASRKIRLA